MAFGSEVSAKLGIDTASVPADLNKAKQAFTKFGQDVEAAGAAHGAGAGDKLVGALEHKLLGSRHLAGALAVALGLNIEHIAEGITAGLVGGTKEAWKQMGELAEENAKLIEKRMELAMTPKQLQEHQAKNRKRAEGELEGAANEAGENAAKRIGLDAAAPGAALLASLLGFINSEAEEGVNIQKKTKVVLEGEVESAEQSKAVAESHKKLDEYRHEMSLKNLTSSEKLKAINEEINRLLSEEVNGKLTAIEIDERKRKVIELQGQEQEELNARTQREIDMKQELGKLQGDLAAAQRKRDQDEEDIAQKRADRGKQTVDEIADLKDSKKDETASGPVDTFGLSDEAGEAKKSAVAIQRQQKEAERLRRSGDVSGANQLFDQISAGKQKLVDSGFAKSSEGDEFKKMAEQIHKDNSEIAKILQAISVTAQGKLKNQ